MRKFLIIFLPRFLIFIVSSHQFSSPARRETDEMAQNSSLTMTQRQRQFLAQQQIRLARLLELSAPELEEAVERQLEENPALEAVNDEETQLATDDGSRFRETAEEVQNADYASKEEIPFYRYEANNRSADDDRRRPVQPDNSRSLYEILLRQLRQRKLPEKINDIAEYIIGNVDSNGYLRRTPVGIADDILFTYGVEVSEEEVNRALEAVHSLEPYGIGAADLRECLLIQLRHLPASETRDDAFRIIDEAFEAFSMKHIHRIISSLRMGAKRVERAIALILTLNPKPGASLGNEPGSDAPQIIPDFIIDVIDGQITVSLNNRIPDLAISRSFEQAVADMERNAADRRKRDKQRDFVFLHYNEARDFIKLLRQRQTTLFSVMTAIVQAQKEFFLTDDVHTLHPLGIKDIAAATGYDISVISRATANKYAATPRGVFPLRYFFSDSLGEEGEEFTAKSVQQVMQSLIDSEDKLHPLSDEKIKQMLVAMGFDVSRRTVAKYRDRMRIPVARLRKKM